MGDATSNENAAERKTSWSPEFPTDSIMLVLLPKEGRL